MGSGLQSITKRLFLEEPRLLALASLGFAVAKLSFLDNDLRSPALLSRLKLPELRVLSGILGYRACFRSSMMFVSCSKDKASILARDMAESDFSISPCNLLGIRAGDFGSFKPPLCTWKVLARC